MAGCLVARSILCGESAGPAGWHRALDAAVALALDDRELLRIADELFAAARDLRTATGVRVYAESTAATVVGCEALAFLDGMACVGRSS
jgi:hypothetical protein